MGLLFLYALGFACGLSGRHWVLRVSGSYPEGPRDKGVRRDISLPFGTHGCFPQSWWVCSMDHLITELFSKTASTFASIISSIAKNNSWHYLLIGLLYVIGMQAVFPLLEEEYFWYWSVLVPETCTLHWNTWKRSQCTNSTIAHFGKGTLWMLTEWSVVVVGEAHL